MKKIGKNQIFIIITIAILVIGMALLGVFGFNKSIDAGDKYEIQITAESAREEHITLIQETCDAYFAENNVNVSSYSIQMIDEGETIIYKSTSDLQGAVAGLKTALDGVLGSTSLIVEVNAFEVNAYNNYEITWVIIALAVAVVGTFIYLIYMQKLSGALTALAVSLLSGLLYVALLGITRIPCDPTFIAFGAVAVILGGVLAIGIVGRCIELIKNVGNDKVSNYELANMALKKSYKRIWVVLGTLVIVSIALVALSICGYFMFAGVQLLCAVISGGFSAIAWTPLIWPTLKKYKRNKRAQIAKTEEAN